MIPVCWYVADWFAEHPERGGILQQRSPARELAPRAHTLSLVDFETSSPRRPRLRGHRRARDDRRFPHRAACSAGARCGRGEGGTAAFSVLRTTLGAAILLGLEVLVAADLIRTITSKPSMEDALILGIIVLIRTILSMSIQIEIEGMLPWRRACSPAAGR